MQLGHVADIDNWRQFAQVLGHPQADVGSAGEHQRLRSRCQRGIELAQAAGSAVTWELQLLLRGGPLERTQWMPMSLGMRFGTAPALGVGILPHAAAGIDDRAVARATTQVSRKRIHHLAARRRRFTFEI